MGVHLKALAEYSQMNTHVSAKSLKILYIVLYWPTLALSLPVAMSQNMDLAVNLADTTSRYFPKNMGHPEPMKIIIIKKYPKLWRIYDN